MSGCGGGRWGASPRPLHERLLRELIGGGGRSTRKRLNGAEQVGASGIAQNVNAILLHGPEKSRLCSLLARGKHGRGEVEGRTRWGRRSRWLLPGALACFGWTSGGLGARVIVGATVPSLPVDEETPAEELAWAREGFFFLLLSLTATLLRIQSLFSVSDRSPPSAPQNPGPCLDQSLSTCRQSIADCSKPASFAETSKWDKGSVASATQN
jgi:hypothetical protein